jgi:hypothetical protein
VFFLLNRLFHFKFFQTFYYSRGQGELFEGIFLLFRGKGCVSLFIYLKVVQNDPKLLDFGLINSLPFSKKRALAKEANDSCLRKGV